MTYEEMYKSLKTQFDLLNKNYDILNKKYIEKNQDLEDTQKYWNSYRRNLLKQLKECHACCENCYWLSKHENSNDGIVSDFYCSATKWDFDIPEKAIDKQICHRFEWKEEFNMKDLFKNNFNNLDCCDTIFTGVLISFFDEVISMSQYFTSIQDFIDKLEKYRDVCVEVHNSGVDKNKSLGVNYEDKIR